MTRWLFFKLHWRVGLKVLAAIFRRKVPPALSAQRRGACEACQLRDSDGARLYRLSGAIRTCGAPLWERPKRSAADGCGCLLSLKWRTAGESCPLGRWS